MLRLLGCLLRLGCCQPSGNRAKAVVADARIVHFDGAADFVLRAARNNVQRPTAVIGHELPRTIHPLRNLTGRRIRRRRFHATEGDVEVARLQGFVRRGCVHERTCCHIGLINDFHFHDVFLENCTANARALGSGQIDALRAHQHGMPYQLWDTHSGTSGGMSGSGSSGYAAQVTNSAGGTETRPVNTAYAPRIHI
ncbi:protein of unknown function [Burkholderia multivorans]